MSRLNALCFFYIYTPYQFCCPMICKKERRNFLAVICSFLFLLKRKKKFCAGFVVFLIFFRFFLVDFGKIRRDLKFRSEILVSTDIHRLPKFWTQFANPGLFFSNIEQKNQKNYKSLTKILFSFQ